MRTSTSSNDTPLSIIAIPEPWRSKLVVAAAADFFFDARWKGIIAALSLNAIPIDREVTGRKTSDQLKRLIEDGWSLVIYPEGVWYSCPTKEDIDEVLATHLVKGDRVERLMLQTADKLPKHRVKA